MTDEHDVEPVVPRPPEEPLRVLPDGRAAPRLWIQFQCPRCFVCEIRDAFLGVPLHGCTTPKAIMVAERIVDPQDVPW